VKPPRNERDSVEVAVRIAVALIGVALIVGAFLSWFAEPEVSVTETAGPASPEHGLVIKTTETSEGLVTKRIETTSQQTTKTTTTEGAARSDTVTLAFLGVGVLALLAGVFYGNLDSLSAAGLSIKFRDAATSLDKLNEAVRKATETSASQQKALDAVHASLVDLAARVALLEPAPLGIDRQMDELGVRVGESRASLRAAVQIQADADEAIATFKRAVR
jgi:hypothetical protein